MKCFAAWWVHSRNSLHFLQSQANLAEYYAAFFVLFAILEFNQNASTTILHGLGLL